MAMRSCAAYCAGSIVLNYILLAQMLQLTHAVSEMTSREICMYCAKYHPKQREQMNED